MKQKVIITENDLHNIILESVSNTLSMMGIDPRTMMSDFGDDDDMIAAKNALDTEDEEGRIANLIRNYCFNGKRMYDKPVDFNKIKQILEKNNYIYSGSDRVGESYYFDNKNNGYRVVIVPEWFFPKFGGVGKIRNFYIKNIN